MKSTFQWAPPYSLGLLLALAVAALAGYALLRWASGRPIAPARRVGLLAIRLAILALVGLIVLNPVRVDETPGTVERPRVFYLLDASQSMAIGKGTTTRWEQVVGSIREADRARDPRGGAQVSLFRFGSRLASIEGDFLHPESGGGTHPAEPGSAVAAEPPRREEPPPAPTDSDTLLVASLEGLTNRFGQAPPQAVVVFSDGRARDPDRADAIARAYSKMKVPIHVFPAGEPGVGGDVAIVAMVALNQVRKSSKVAAQVFVRSFGYNGRHAGLKIMAGAPSGQADAVLAQTPIVLEDGLRSYSLSFESGDQDRRIEARIDPQPGEVSTSNNAFAADMAIDHTKIRVLYLEGSSERFIQRAVQSVFGRGSVRGAYSPLQDALMEDRDIDCTAVAASGSSGDFTFPVRTDNGGPGIPEIASELFAYDVIILSNVPVEALDAKYQGWIEEWVGRRGGGLLMVGGPYSFESGRWNGTRIAAMLPVELGPGPGDWSETAKAVHPVVAGAVHPIWQITSDEVQNRSLLGTLPRFLGGNRLGRVKQAADVLARDDSPGVGGEPAATIAAQPYGRGRTMVMAPAITRRWAGEFAQSWGGPDARYYKKYWAQRRVLAVRELLDRPAPPAGRDRQAAIPPGRADRPEGPSVRRGRVADARLSRGRHRRAEVVDRVRPGQLAAAPTLDRGGGGPWGGEGAVPPLERGVRAGTRDIGEVVWGDLADRRREVAGRRRDPHSGAPVRADGVREQYAGRQLVARGAGPRRPDRAAEHAARPRPAAPAGRAVRRQGPGRVEGPLGDARATAADRRPSRGQGDARLEPMAADLRPDRPARHRMGLATASRPGLSARGGIGSIPC